MTNLIAAKVYDISLIIADLKLAPQTYETILKNELKNGTLLTILRRKLSVLVKHGIIRKTVIPATRYSRIIYYCLNKPYTILFESSRMGCNVFYFDKYTRVNKFEITTELCYQLSHSSWVEVYGKRFFEGNVLMMI